MLQGELAGGAFGTGIGPLQRESGTAIRQFVSARDNILSGGGPSPDFQALVDSLATVNRREMNTAAGDLRESFGAQGARFGTASANAEATMRRENAQDFNAQIGTLGESARQFDTQALLSAIGMMSQMGTQSMAPFLSLAQQGILPDEVVASPNPWLQLATAAIGGAGNFFGAKR